VLSYFVDPSELYFPNGHIDLRYGIQASLVESKDGKEPTAFTVTTDQRRYYLRADSAPSAKEWVKALQKVIFRSHNEGDSVKISIPVANVLEVEESPVLEFADTIKLKVVDNDDTYAIDEVSVAPMSRCPWPTGTNWTIVFLLVLQFRQRRTGRPPSRS
jgi:sterol 3beta-glucosyltransferase